MSYHEKVAKILKDIKENPRNHQHSFGGLQSCCIVDSCLDMQLVEAHKHTVPQRNPGG